MKKQFLTLLFLFLFSLTCVSVNAAKRMGSGKPVGQQSGNVSQREAAKPAQPGTPAGSPAAAPSAPSPASAPMASPTRRPWGAMVGGLAAGLGLAWLAHSMGFGAELGQFMMFGLIALGIMLVVGYFMRRRAAANTSDVNRSPLAFQGAGATPPVQQQTTQFNTHPTTASASSGSMIGSAVSQFQPTWSIPAGFDSEGFVSKAKENFVIMQDAWDRSDTASLRNLMTDEMLTQIKAQLDERDATTAVGQMTKTEVVNLDA